MQNNPIANLYLLDCPETLDAFLAINLLKFAHLLLLITYSCAQGVVGFYDARDVPSCGGASGNDCSWTPRAGTLGPLTGTATISDGWVMNPRMSTTGNTGITGSQAHTSVVGFKLSSGGLVATRTLVQIGSASQCLAQLVAEVGVIAGKGRKAA